MVDSTPPTVPSHLDFPEYMHQFYLADTWSIGELGVEIDRMLDKYEAYLAGPVEGRQVGSYAVRKLPKKRCRPITAHPNPPTIHASRTLYTSLPLDKAKLGRINPEYEELDALLLEAARLASLEHFAIEGSMLDGANSSVDTPATSNGLHLEVHHTAHSCSPTPPAEYNAYGCITARSKGKG
ncbi:hypothetical protein FS749_000456 [Ceratobasidium sp. UAMH 11750]|nr:hypothetical protein FS749_000456 [Ceratobasidium sp. UAMH 11750]